MFRFDHSWRLHNPAFCGHVFAGVASSEVERLIYFPCQVNILPGLQGLLEKNAVFRGEEGFFQAYPTQEVNPRRPDESG